MPCWIKKAGLTPFFNSFLICLLYFILYFYTEHFQRGPFNFQVNALFFFLFFFFLTFSGQCLKGLT
jgi:hypothetical protein